MNNEKQAEAKAARREYMRKWRADHPEAVRAAQDRYWAKKAEEKRSAIQIQNEERDDHQ